MSKAKTSCGGCVFAEIEEEQKGCKVGRLDRFIELGKAELIDGEGLPDIFLIDGICNMYKQDDGSGIFKQMEYQTQKTHLNITYFVISNGDTNEVNKTLAHVKKKERVVIANEGDRLSLSSLKDVENLLITQNLDEDQNSGNFLSEVFGKIKNSLTCVVRAGYNVPEDLEAIINRKVNTDLDIRLMYEFDECYVVNSEVARQLGFFIGSNLDEKIRKIVNAQESK